MTSFVKNIFRYGCENFQWATTQGKEFLGFAPVREQIPLNRRFIEPLVSSHLSVIHRERITSVITVVAGATLLPQLMAPTFLGRTVGLFALTSSLRAVDKLMYQLPDKQPQVSREVELAERYAVRSDQEISVELKSVLSLVLSDQYYDEPTQELIKACMKASSVERGCVPMLIRYKIALEKCKVLVSQTSLLEAVGERSKSLALAKLDAAFALTVLCYPKDMKATSLQDLTRETSWLPQRDVEAETALNKKFVQPIAYPNDTTLIDGTAGLSMLAPGLHAINKLLYQFSNKDSVQVSREMKIAEEYAARSDEEIHVELKNILRGILLSDEFYNDDTQDLIKRGMKTSSVERGCVPMLIHYKLAFEKYKALENQLPLIEAIGNVTRKIQTESYGDNIRERLYKAQSPFFKELFLAKLEAAFALAVLCYPTEMKATSLKELGQVNPCFLEESDLEYAELPFFIKRSCILALGQHSYRFAKEADFISCKDLGDNSVQDFVEELKEINDSQKESEEAIESDESEVVMTTPGSSRTPPRSSRHSSLSSTSRDSDSM